MPNLGTPFRLKKKSRLGNKTSRHWGRFSSGSWRSDASAGVLFFGLFSSSFPTSSAFIVSRENLRLVFYVFCFYRWGLWVFKMTVSSNKCKKGIFPPVCMSEMIVLKLAQLNWKLYWILQVSDPLNKFRGIMKRLVCFCFFLSNFGNIKKSLWPPVIEQNAPSICNVLG